MANVEQEVSNLISEPSLQQWLLDYSTCFRVLECLVAVAFFAMASNLINFDFIRFARLFRRWSPDEVEFRQLNVQIAQVSRKMAPLSPVNDFAQYFKHERIRNRLVDERNAVSQRISRDAMLNSFKTNLPLRLLLFLLSLAMALHIGDQLTLLRIPEANFYPFNFLLRFPHMLWSAQEGGEISISLFNFALMALFVRRAYLNRAKDLAKKAG